MSMNLVLRILHAIVEIVEKTSILYLKNQTKKNIDSSNAEKIVVAILIGNMSFSTLNRRKIKKRSVSAKSPGV